MARPIIFEQSGVIPYRQTANGLQVLLITSRRRKRWVIPKGLVEHETTPRDSAAQEAWEEAGISGQLTTAPVGRYEYQKWGGICQVDVYLLRVEQIYDSWPEADFRTREWLTPEEAARRVDEPDLKQMILALPAQFRK